MMFAATGCAIHGCGARGKVVCDFDGTNCRWEGGFDGDFGPPYPEPPGPRHPWGYSSSSGTAPSDGGLAAVAASYGVDDTNNDGILSCSGTYWIDTGAFEGSCE